MADASTARLEQARQAAQQALRNVSVTLAPLAGLASVVRLELDARVPTAGIFASGRLAVNPAWFVALAPADAAFVMAHELMHLALRTHDRAVGSQARLFNIAPAKVV